MAGPNTITGARAIVKITAKDANGKDTAVEVGIFNNVSGNVGIDIVPINVLGSLLPVELAQVRR